MLSLVHDIFDALDDLQPSCLRHVSYTKMLCILVVLFRFLLYGNCAHSSRDNDWLELYISTQVFKLVGGKEHCGDVP